MGLLDRLFGSLTMDSFARSLVKEAQRNGIRDVVYDADNSRITYDNGAISLINIYAEHSKLPRSERRQHLRTLSSLFLHDVALPDSLEEARLHLLPKVWSRAGIAFAILEDRLKEGEGKFDIPNYHAGSHLIASIAYDLPTSIRSIDNENLETWGLSYYEALEIARENLETMPMNYARIGDGFYTIMSGDNYDSSRLLLIDKIQEFNVNGNHIAMVPNRDSLLVTGSEDVDGLQCMLGLAEASVDEPRALCCVPIRLDADEWVDWMLPKDHSLYPAFHLLELKYLVPVYDEQKQLLDSIHAQDGTDIFVASVTVVEKKDGRILTYCVWAEGVESLLPKTDLVVFVRDEQGVVASGEWERVHRSVGDLMAEEDYYPLRWRVREFPNGDQLREIGNEMES